MELANLKAKFDIPGAVDIEMGEGGLTRVVVNARGGRHARAEIYLNGATVTRYDIDGKPVLFCSHTSKYEAGKAIRGGVPIIFPWFGPHPSDSKLPQHGVARAAEWRIVSTQLLKTNEAAVEMELDSTDATRAVWPYDFSLRYSVTVGERLVMSLNVTNLSDVEFRYDEALHTYLTVADVRNIQITGMEQTEYIDKVDGMARKRLTDAPLVLEGETDRVFVNTDAACRLYDPERGETVVGKMGSQSTVVWNPWEKADTLADLAGNQWPGMVCIETVNAMENAVTLAPGATHRMTAVIDPSGLR